MGRGVCPGPVLGAVILLLSIGAAGAAQLTAEGYAAATPRTLGRQPATTTVVCLSLTAACLCLFCAFSQPMPNRPMCP